MGLCPCHVVLGLGGRAWRLEGLRARWLGSSGFALTLESLVARGLGSSGFALALGGLVAREPERWGLEQVRIDRIKGVEKLPHHGNSDARPSTVDVFGNPHGAWAPAAGGAVEVAGEGEFEFGPEGKGA